MPMPHILRAWSIAFTTAALCDVSSFSSFSAAIPVVSDFSVPVGVPSIRTDDRLVILSFSPSIQRLYSSYLRTYFKINVLVSLSIVYLSSISVFPLVSPALFALFLLLPFSCHFSSSPHRLRSSSAAVIRF